MAAMLLACPKHGAKAIAAMGRSYRTPLPAE